LALLLIVANLPAAVTNEEKRNPKITQERYDWEATIGDGLEEKRGTHAKPQTR
jgi:hypothetical protein